MSGIDRRSFFKIVAASGAATAAGGCGQAAETLLPYVSPPENNVPGIAPHFSTVRREGPAGLGARARVAYEPIGYEALRAGNRIAFGRDAIPDYAIGDATYLVSFGADFLETWLSPVGHASDFSGMHALAHGRARSSTWSRGCP